MSKPTEAKNWRESLSLGKVFWLLCTMEMWERLAYYGVRVIVPIYIAQADEPGGLHFTFEQKGTIYFWWAVFQSILPTFTGGYADRYGYKKTIGVAITIKIVGYCLMATQRTFTGFLIGCILLATGTAIFKPGIQGTLAHNIDASRSSTGRSGSGPACARAALSATSLRARASSGHGSDCSAAASHARHRCSRGSATRS